MKILTVIIFLVGFLITLVGAFLKITHFSVGPINGNIALTTGIFFELIGIVFVFIIVLSNQKFKGFLKK